MLTFFFYYKLTFLIYLFVINIYIVKACVVIFLMPGNIVQRKFYFVYTYSRFIKECFRKRAFRNVTIQPNAFIFVKDQGSPFLDAFGLLTCEWKR